MDTTPICPGCGKPLAPDAPKGLCQECLLKAGFPSGTETGGKGPRFQPPPVTELAAKFPQLELLGLVGSGGMGAVYRARQKELDRVVAPKILPPDVGEDPAFAERFTREAKALARLNHPNVVTLYEFGRADGLFFFLMEFVDGVNLRQLLEERRLSSREALAVVPQICDALQYAHDQGIVHRDIKPENILLDRRGRVKVADFGLAKLVAAGNEPAAPGETAPETADLTQAGKVMGTPRYMAPEQMEHPGEVDHRADIYALGVVFYQMLTGELPGKRIEPPSRKVQIDVRLDEVVLRALERKPDRRYQKVSQVKTDVETIAASASASIPAPETASAPAAAQIRQAFQHLPLSGTGRTIAVAGIVLAILIGAVFVANYLPRRNRPQTAGSFGPIVECVVTNMIDFDSGALADLPLPTQTGERDPARLDWINGLNGPGPDEGVSWMRRHGMDAIDANHGLIGVDLLLVPLKARQWESLTREDLQEKLQSLGLPTAPATEVLPDSPGIYGFKTREGSLGIVEVTDSRIPRGVKIRYKLALPTTRTNAPTRQETIIYQTAPVTRGPLSQVVVATGTLNPLPTDARQWRIEAIVNEADVVGVETNQDVRFTLDAFPQRTFTGKVLEVGNTPVRQDNMVNYIAWIAVNDPDPRFKPGMTASVAFIVAHRENALRVPNAALVRTNDPNVCIVYVMRAGEEGRPEKVVIRVGISDGVSTEVTEGLQKGDRVLLGIRRVETSRAPGLEELPKDGDHAARNLPESRQTAATESSTVTARPGEYKVTLTNGVSFEVVGILRNPRGTGKWMRPDGTPFDTPPAEITEISERPRMTSSPTDIPPDDEFLIYARWHRPEAIEQQLIRTKTGWSYRAEWTPPPDAPDSVATMRDLETGKSGTGEIIYFRNPPVAVDCQVAVAVGPWEPVAIYDGARTKETVRGVMVVCSAPSYDPSAKAYRFEVMHNLDRNRYALRMIARLKNGAEKEFVFHSGPQTGNPAKGFSLIYPDDFGPADVREYILERTPWVRGEIDGIALQPGTTNRSPASTHAEGAVRFGSEKEFTMTEFNNRLGREALDFDTGTLFAQPRDFEEGSEAGLTQWVEHNGIDLLVDHGPRGVWGLMTTTNAELKIAPVDPQKWDRIGERELTEALAGGPAPLAALQRGILKVYVPPEGAPSPLTCAFQTSKGSRGLLQILGDSGNPPGVKIRYKLVRAEAAANSQPLLAGSTSLTFGPVIEAVLNDLDDRRGSEALDLRTGQVSSIPTEVFNDPEVWFQTNQMNLLVECVDNRWGFMVKEVDMAAIANRHWEGIQPEDVRRRLASGRSGLEVRERNGHRFYLLARGAKPPLNFAFQTDAKDLGLLQITRLSENPRSATIRYKLAGGQSGFGVRPGGGAGQAGNSERGAGRR